MITRVWACKWNIARLAICGLVLWVLVVDTAPRLARRGLASLPDFDYAGEVSALRAQGRFGEAVRIGEAGLERYAAAPADPRRAAIEHELARARDEQASWVRRVKDIGQGALTGQGQTLEALIGAVGSDMLVFGDVRDLVIQGTRLVVDGEADPVIAALSGLGLALTIAPEIDWGASVLKVARKSGALARGLADEVIGMARRGARTDVMKFAGDVGTLAKAGGPAGALRVLKSARSTDDVARVAGFVRRQGTGGAAALHIAGDEGVKWIVKNGDDVLLVRAAAKGPAGVAYAASPKRLPLLLRPHPLLGLTKGVYKGNVEAFISRALDALGAAAFWLLPLLAGWFTLELWWLAQRWRRLRPELHTARPTLASV